jgi:RHS repeat-associated protein
LVVTYAYDYDSRETGETWHSGNASSSVTNIATFTFDAAGNELTAANANGTYTMSYDADGRVTVVNELGWATLTFQYDAVGNRTSVKDSFGGVQTSVYDADNELVTQQITGRGSTQLEIDLTYTPTGKIASEARDNGLGPTTPVGVSYYYYDAADRLTGITDIGTGSTVLLSYTYSYDPANNLTQEVDNGTLVTYAYNADNELTGAGAATFSYDATGNRTNSGYSTGTGNELTAQGNWTYAYDHAGNETGKTNTSTGEVWTYSYDDKNELTQAVDVVSGLTTTVTYEYDPFGNRIEQSVATSGGTTVTKYAQDGWDPALAGSTGNSNWNVWADLTNASAMQTRYLRGDEVDQIFARISSGGTAAFLLTDHLGSVVGVTNSSGSLTDTIVYDAYGNITSESSPTNGGVYKYTGREFDATTGLQYNRARYYDPTVGRWISQDPMGFDAGDSNLYRYVENAPTIATDPSGFQVGPSDGGQSKGMYPPFTLPEPGPYPSVPGMPLNNGLNPIVFHPTTPPQGQIIPNPIDGGTTAGGTSVIPPFSNPGGAARGLAPMITKVNVLGWGDDPTLRFIATPPSWKNVYRIVDGMANLTLEEKTMLKEAMTYLLESSRFEWNKSIGFFGKCYEWTAKYDTVTSGKLAEMRNTWGKYINVDTMY